MNTPLQTEWFETRDAAIAILSTGPICERGLVIEAAENATEMVDWDAIGGDTEEYPDVWCHQAISNLIELMTMHNYALFGTTFKEVTS